MTESALGQELLDKIEPLILAGEMGVAVACIPDGDRTLTISNTTYWASEQTRTNFERRVTTKARDVGATRVAFGTALILGETNENIGMREPNPNYPPGDDEVEAIWMLVIDLDTGVDICRVDIDRVGGNVSFGTMLVLEGETQMLDGAPGFLVVQGLAS